MWPMKPATRASKTHCATSCWNCARTCVLTTFKRDCEPSWRSASRNSRVTDMAETVYIVGVGMTPFGRHLDKSVKQIAAWAIEDALKDGGIERREIGAAFFGNTMW